MAQSDDEVIIKQGLMKKRSQNKKIYTPVNYKVRWFILTKHYFIYYDNENEEVSRNKSFSFNIYCRLLSLSFEKMLDEYAGKNFKNAAKIFHCLLSAPLQPFNIPCKVGCGYQGANFESISLS